MSPKLTVIICMLSELKIQEKDSIEKLDQKVHISSIK